jgi:hypothetical protein
MGSEHPLFTPPRAGFILKCSTTMAYNSKILLASDMLSNHVFPMKALKTGFLMVLVCTALYVQIDPRIWSGICQLLARFLVGW